MTTKDLASLFKKYPFSAVCIALILAGSAIYFLRKDAPTAAQAMLDQRAKESRRLQGNITNSAQLKEHLSQLQEINARVNARLMRADDLAKNQQYFYKIESEAGVKLSDLRSGPGSSAPLVGGKPAPKTTYGIVPYTCTVNGTYNQLLTFVRKIEEGEHFMRLISANVSLGSGAADESASLDPQLTLTLSVEFLGQS